MKYACILIIFLLFGCKQTQPNSPRFIKFEHTGIVNKLIRPLYISTKKLDIHLNDEQIADLKRIIGHANITPQNEEDYINMKYNRMVTNDRTFLIIYKFIFDHREYYVNKAHQNDDVTARSFDIYIDGETTFSVYYKLKDGNVVKNGW